MKKSLTSAFITIFLCINLFALSQRDASLAEKAYRLGRSFMEKNNFKKAKIYLEYSFKKNPAHPFTFARLVILLEKMKEYKRLIQIYEPYTKKNKGNSLINFNMGSFAMQAKEYKKALTYLIKAYTINENHLKAVNNISLCYAALKNYDKSIEYAKILYLKKYSLINTLKILSSSYLELSKYDEAIKYAGELVEKTNWTDAFNINTLSLAYAGKKNYKKAIELLKKAIAIKGNALFKINLEKYKKLLKSTGASR
jgi:tetratricopeptide (TPR) repeat protein